MKRSCCNTHRAAANCDQRKGSLCLVAAAIFRGFCRHISGYKREPPNWHKRLSTVLCKTLLTASQINSEFKGSCPVSSSCPSKGCGLCSPAWLAVTCSVMFQESLAGVTMNPCQTTCTTWCWEALSGEGIWPHIALTAVPPALSTAVSGSDVVKLFGPTSLARLCAPHQDKREDHTSECCGLALSVLGPPRTAVHHYQVNVA